MNEWNTFLLIAAIALAYLIWQRFSKGVVKEGFENGMDGESGTFPVIDIDINTVGSGTFTTKSKSSTGFGQGKGSCDKSKCGALDPVLDPRYNIMELIKGSILLEDHLNQEGKRCRDCICKHFLSLVAYANEGISLAGSKINEYPGLEKAAETYAKLFDEWKKNKSDVVLMIRVADSLRETRKGLMEKYV
jgi:hypothetical protein